jgi:hypothetical protein
MTTTVRDLDMKIKTAVSIFAIGVPSVLGYCFLEIKEVKKLTLENSKAIESQKVHQQWIKETLNEIKSDVKSLKQ